MKNLGTLSNKRLYVGLLLLLIINSIQAVFTEINPDEAYYAYWSEHLAWGYFDHPPMVAIIIRISSWFFSGNIGVRLITLLLQPLALFITWQLCETGEMPSQKRLVVFFTTASAMVMMVAYGFFTTPDAPLLFFTALFLFGYKRFLSNSNTSNALLLALAMAGMIYSKYQGALVIILLLLSNLRLIRNPRFMLAATLAFLICVPHFTWQFKNNFPSFQYHLIGRSKSFKWNYFFEYIPNQLATFNPFVFVAMVWLIIKYRAADLFERSLFFIIVGLISFFWLATFRGHAEPHWTVAASIPALILIVNYSSINQKFYNYVLRFIGSSLILILLIRIFLMTNILPAKLEFSGKQAKYEAIEKIAKSTPVIFTGSFQNSSLYHFFTKENTTVISSLYSRQTQFDIWQKDRQLQGKRVFLVGEYGNQTKEYRINNQVIKGFFIDSFQSTRDLFIRFQETKKNYVAGEKVKFLIEIENTGKYPVLFQHPQLPVTIKAIISGKNNMEEIDGECSENILMIKNGEMKKVYFSFILPKLNPGEYKMGFSCSSLTGLGINSSFINVNLSR